MVLKKISINYNFKIIIPNGTPSYVSDSIGLLGLEPFYFNSSEYLKISNLYHINYLAISGFSHPAIKELVTDLKKSASFLSSSNMMASLIPLALISGCKS